MNPGPSATWLDSGMEEDGTERPCPGSALGPGTAAMDSAVAGEDQLLIRRNIGNSMEIWGIWGKITNDS